MLKCTIHMLQTPALSMLSVRNYEVQFLVENRTFNFDFIRRCHLMITYFKVKLKLVPYTLLKYTMYYQCTPEHAILHTGAPEPGSPWLYGPTLRKAKKASLLSTHRTSLSWQGII